MPKPTERDETIKVLTEHGHRVEYVSPDFVLLAIPNQAGTIRIVTVSNDGSIEAGTLSDFLNQVLK
jgi:hypothetical protein